MEKIKRKQRHGFGMIFGSEEISLFEGAVIASFFPEAEEITIKEIQERTEYSYERVNSALKSLAKKKIVAEKQIGKTLVYSLDLNNIYSQIGFSHYMLEREIDFIKRHKNIFKVIEKISENPLTWQVILFGSYSKRTENKQSDIDLLVSCIPGKEKEVENFVKSLKYDTNIEFSLVVLSMHELSNIKKDNPELWQDLREFGIIFKGEDSFYYQMYKNGR